MMVGLFFGGYRAGAAGTGAGSASDPLITKSYLDSRLEGFSGASSSASYVKVTVEKGETLVFAEGTEFFMYSGAGDVSRGTLVNLSTGYVFKQGNTMVQYNLFFSGENSGGVRVTSKAVFYIKGNYTIE